MDLFLSVFRNKENPGILCTQPFPVSAIHSNGSDFLGRQQNIRSIGAIVAGYFYLVSDDLLFLKNITGIIINNRTLVGAYPYISFPVLCNGINPVKQSPHPGF